MELTKEITAGAGGKLLKILKGNTSFVSGENLCRSLSVSRVSVWKQIRRLRELGYPIEVSRRGYLWQGEADLLYPWEFPKREFMIHYFNEVYSTMDEARFLAEKESVHGTIVVAEKQKKGRGRRERLWYSQTGGLYITLVLRTPLFAAYGFYFSFAASIAVARTLRQLYGIRASVKWPNDVLVEGRKIAGILSDMRIDSEVIRYLNLGIGINVNNDPTKEVPSSCSVMGILGKRVFRKEFLSALLDELDNRTGEIPAVNPVKEWKDYTSTLGRKVSVVSLSGTVSGTAVDVDEAGALILKQKNGSRKRVLFGDCFYDG